MPTALLRMIGQQAGALDRMAGLDLARPAAVLARLADHAQQRGGHEVPLSTR